MAFVNLFLIIHQLSDVSVYCRSRSFTDGKFARNQVHLSQRSTSLCHPNFYKLLRIATG